MPKLTHKLLASLLRGEPVLVYSKLEGFMLTARLKLILEKGEVTETKDPLGCLIGITKESKIKDSADLPAE